MARPQSWGTQSTTSSNEEILSDLSQSLRSSIYRTTNTRYTPQTGNELYPTSGAMDDWAASVGFVGFTIELRDEFDFVVPSSQIVPTGEDGWAAVKALMEYAIENPGVLGPQRVVPSDGKYIMNDRPRMEVLKPKKTTKKRVRSKPTKKPQPWL